jgi:diacylglycerol kinase (ATP)
VQLADSHKGCPYATTYSPALADSHEALPTPVDARAGGPRSSDVVTSRATMRVLVIYNPTAGRGRASRKIDAVMSRLKERGAQPELATSRDSADLSALAAKFDSSRFDRVAVCGGDGTLHHFVRSLPLDRSILGIIPSGSGDDLAKTLRIPRDPVAASDVILDGEVLQIDVPTLNSIRFLGVAGLGFDSEVARYANDNVKYLRGSLIYLWAILRVLPKFVPKKVRVTVDGKTTNEELMFSVIANSPQYGGGIRIAPTASLSDGVLDLYIVRRCSRAMLLRTLPLAYSGKHVNSDFVHAATGTTFRFESDTPLDVFADGEFVTQTPLEVKLGAEKLSVVVPRS